MAELSSSRVTCPVCAAPLEVVGRSWTVDELLRLWPEASFSDRTRSELLAQGEHSALNRCSGCGLEIFVPTLVGGPSFYAEAYHAGAAQGDFSKTAYVADKWDFEEAAKDLVGARSVVDIGCGDGAFLEIASRSVADVVGVDASPAARARALGRGVVVHEDEAALAGRRGSFDVAASFHVLEHAADPLAFLTGLSSWIRPGGRLCLSVPDQDGIGRFVNAVGPCGSDMPPHHVTRWNLRSLAALVAQAGLKIDRVALEPLDLRDHVYYSHYAVTARFPGDGFEAKLARLVLSRVLGRAAELAQRLGLRRVPRLRGQAIYLALSAFSASSGSRGS